MLSRDLATRINRNLTRLAQMIDVPRWVAGLRSGEFPQGKYALETFDGKFCCLGVMCLLHPELFIRTTRVEHSPYPGEPDWSGVVYTGVESGQSSTGLPPMPIESEYHYWALPIPASRGLNDAPVTLSELNDSGQFTFDQIADLIEHFVRPDQEG